MTRPVLVLLFALCLPAVIHAQKFDAPGADAILKDALSRWNAPGLAAAVVQGDRVVYLKGFGVREAGKDEKVTPRTVFAFASLTKAFAAAGLALLVEEGKAGWDDPVRTHLPWFRLSDPLADRQVCLRDLFCHRIGLSRHDLLWHRAPWSLEETVKRMAHLEPSSSFRSRYEYNNLAYVAAGLTIAQISGTAWHEFTRKRLLEPLGMKDAVFTAAEARAAADHATPHRRAEEGMPEPMGWYEDAKQIRASGSLKGSVADLSAWMRMQLAEGRFEGKRILSAASVKEMRAPQIVVPPDTDLERRMGSTQHGYGLGWHVTDYHGRLLVEHGGAADGFRARILLLPRQKFGLALLTNVEDMNFLQAAAFTLLDHALGRKKSDWHEFYEKRDKAAKDESKAKEKRLLASRKKGTRPSRELAAYAGTFRDAAYGDVVVAAKGKEAELRWGGIRARLEHFHYDTFILRAGKKGEKETIRRRPEGELASFALDANGDVAQVKFLGRTFRRVKPAK